MLKSAKKLLRTLPGVGEYVSRHHAALREIDRLRPLALEKDNLPFESADQIVQLIEAYLARYGETNLSQKLRDKNIYLYKQHYYRPMMQPADLPDNYWNKTHELAGVSIDTDACFNWFEQTCAPFMAEFRKQFPTQKPADYERGFYLVNGTYMAVDAHVYYCTIRGAKPKRVYEIGAGNSTVLSHTACRLNREEGHNSVLTVFEPYPDDHLVQTGYKSEVDLRQLKIQDVPLETFQQLEAGDILFIDSTHIFREGDDVQFLYCEVLPRLKKGVYVHIHDISLPKPYPKVYMDNGWFWNEQYFLQCLLTHNPHAQIVWPGNYLMCHAPDKMRALFPEIAEMRQTYTSSEPSSFWYQTK